VGAVKARTAYTMRAAPMQGPARATVKSGHRRAAAARRVRAALDDGAEIPVEGNPEPAGADDAAPEDAPPEDFVEAAGGEIVFASLGEWFHFTTWDYKNYTALMDLYVDFFKSTVSEFYQNHTERKLVEPVAHLLRFPHETPIGKLMENLKPYYHSDLNSEATLSMGKAIDMFKHDGACGIINVMPFSCMPGIITAAMAPRLRADLENIPWLDLIFDGQEGTNLKTRLEAFIYQAVQFQRRKKAS